MDETSQAALSSVVNPSVALRTAIEELLRFGLIRQEGRDLWVHRVVQEAMNYYSTEELQESFDCVSRLVYEAFPKQMHDSFILDRSACQSFISHGVHISYIYSTLAATKVIVRGYESPLCPKEP